MSAPRPHLVRLSSCTVNLDTGAVLRGGRLRDHLTERERALLAWLVERPGEAVDRSTLLVEVWGYHERVVSRTVDTTMRRLRRKVEADPSDPEELRTVHGVGYCFLPPRG